MRAALLLGLAVIAGIPNDAPGQTRTEDGVAALARGDYERAVEILKPIAEDWRSRDTAAQFFMAGLYDAGRGVPRDPLRACALYIRASSEYNDPFGRQATALAAASIGRARPEFNEECQLLATVDFNHGFEPITFDLGPGHFVHWTRFAATVTFQGRTSEARVGSMWLGGAQFLPLRYTELATGPIRTLRRHFVEVFLWQPSNQGAQWELHWNLFEVVREQVIPIETTSEALARIESAAPSREPFDVRDYAGIRVDDDGNAAWAVLKGPRPMTQRIKTEAERIELAAEEREARETDRARDAALKKVDWSRRHDVNRQPTMSYVDADGCGLIHVYGWTADRAEVGTVRIDAAALGLSSQPMTFDLARNSANISVETYVYDAPRRRFDFCTDVVFTETGASQPTRWRAVAGTITIEMSPPGARTKPRATVTLTNIVLQNDAGMTVKIVGPVRLTASVGSVFG
jgi:hypothetical protein